MIKLTFLYSVGLMVGTYLLATSAMPGFQVGDNNNGTDPVKVQCWNNTHFMLGLIPDPRNCNRFYYCAYGGSDWTTPQEEWCASDDGAGSRLFYDFRNCRCDFSTRGCYNDSDNGDQKDFFKCADAIPPPVEFL